MRTHFPQNVNKTDFCSLKLSHCNFEAITLQIHQCLFFISIYLLQDCFIIIIINIIILISSWYKILKNADRNQPSSRYNYSFYATLGTSKENVRHDYTSPNCNENYNLQYFIPFQPEHFFIGARILYIWLFLHFIFYCQLFEFFGFYCLDFAKRSFIKKLIIFSLKNCFETCDSSFES